MCVHVRVRLCDKLNSAEFRIQNCASKSRLFFLALPTFNFLTHPDAIHNRASQSLMLRLLTIILRLPPGPRA